MRFQGRIRVNGTHTHLIIPKKYVGGGKHFIRDPKVARMFVHGDEVVGNMTNDGNVKWDTLRVAIKTSQEEETISA